MFSPFPSRPSLIPPEYQFQRHCRPFLPLLFIPLPTTVPHAREDKTKKVPFLSICQNPTFTNPSQHYLRSQAECHRSFVPHQACSRPVHHCFPITGTIKSKRKREKQEEEEEEALRLPPSRERKEENETHQKTTKTKPPPTYLLLIRP